MHFFIPAATTDKQAESIYQTLAINHNAPFHEKRIYQMQWEHEGLKIDTKVGDLLAPHFGIKQEKVLAIFDCGHLFKICTPKRGAIHSAPIIVSRMFIDKLVYFNK